MIGNVIGNRHFQFDRCIVRHRITQIVHDLPGLYLQPGPFVDKIETIAEKDLHEASLPDKPLAAKALLAEAFIPKIILYIMSDEKELSTDVEHQAVKAGLQSGAFSGLTKKVTTLLHSTSIWYRHLHSLQSSNVLSSKLIVPLRKTSVLLISLGSSSPYARMSMTKAHFTL